jgi:hypothetical protein
MIETITLRFEERGHPVVEVVLTAEQARDVVRSIDCLLKANTAEGFTLKECERVGFYKGC